MAVAEVDLDTLAEHRDLRRTGTDPRCAALLEDIRKTLRVPTVDRLFCAAAPAQLERFWTAVRQRVASRPFERAADELRAFALLPGAAGTPLLEVSEGIRAIIETDHYVAPKLLLLATAWRRGAAAARAAAPEHESPLPRGIAHGTAKAPLIDPGRAEGELLELLTEIRAAHDHPELSASYCALANWPGALASLWSAVRTQVGRPAYRRRREDLVQAAERRADGLGLVGGEPPPTALARAVCGHQTRLLPELLIDLGLIRAAVDGLEAARGSPHSVR